MSADHTEATVFFGYGSNLWKHQMRERCPKSKYLGIARLKGYKWIINERGYANVVQIVSKEDDDEKKKHEYSKEVWGLVYSLDKQDEKNLDGNEGVPRAYTKEWLQVDYWQADAGEDDVVACQEEKAKKVNMLVYINRKQISESKPKEEYIYRMNMGIEDAVEEGMPEEYVKQVMRNFIPEVEDEVVEEVVKEESVRFEAEKDRFT
ncbi:hypothetical protein LTR78_008070 [Recurvomyces mirabilis]|uniref:gamma-glutamylcyclotransferase n=1 Tax=Recurvomyces mirabilis TaxID=574656 RepID=A0AAE0TQU1_9PEZI|nr:hypothetical protein LTR78_008070 [Recurvomyces mirabilis]KAK5150797.1 hypothetical protein LTS14_009861 [Recurvomyces mirabilis]